METFASIHSFSIRLFTERIPEFDYKFNMRVLQVTQNGTIIWMSYY
jgi:hypothetical protein